MPAHEYAKGDRVRPVGGGQVMTVEEVYAEVFNYRFRCVWNDADGHPHHELFRVEELEAISTPAK